jgi:hypothetical protein
MDMKEKIVKSPRRVPTHLHHSLIDKLDSEPPWDDEDKGLKANSEEYPHWRPKSF